MDDARTTPLPKSWSEPDELAVRSYDHPDGHLVFEAIGSVSLTTAETLDAALLSCDPSAAAPITVDLRRVSFLDSSGLAVLVQASKRLRSRALPLAPRVVVAPGCQPERILMMGRFGKILEIVHDLGPEAA
jgi:anti-anti-sigma factor